jgi:hypothetical protein
MIRLWMLGFLAVGVGASGCATPTTVRSASPGSGAVASLPLPCNALGLRIDALPVGTHVEHTERDALQTAAAANVGPTSHVQVYVASVQDPVADKVGLGDNTQFRIMWVLDGTDTTPRRTPSGLIGPPSSAGAASPGTVYREVTLIDDQSMTLGGNFNCETTKTANSPDSAAPPSPSAASSPSPASSAFALSLASDRGGQSSPVNAALWFAEHGSVQRIPKTGWKEISTGNAEATVQSGGVQLHVLEGPDQTWQVDSGQYACP